jgi:mono/diheme cytochrome c family protein
MWNHAPAMQAEMEARGLRWPELHDNDVVDLMAYFRTRTPGPRRNLLLQPANAEAGRRLFQKKGCASCHQLRDIESLSAPQQGADPLPRTLGQFAARMWNHSPAMWTRMKAEKVPRPRFSNQEMADVIAYLFVERYFEPAGDVAKGKSAFQAKGCSSCHGLEGERAGGKLRNWRGRMSPITFATVMWNHGPPMAELMGDQNVSWPQFRSGEMDDLIAYLNWGQSRRDPRVPGR